MLMRFQVIGPKRWPDRWNPAFPTSVLAYDMPVTPVLPALDSPRATPARTGWQPLKFKVETQMFN